MEAAQHAEEQGVPLPKLALKHSVKSAVDADIAVTLVGMSSPEEVSHLSVICSCADVWGYICCGTDVSCLEMPAGSRPFLLLFRQHWLVTLSWLHVPETK